MHHIRPGRRLLKHVLVGDGQPHALAGDEVLHHRRELHLPDRVFVVRVFSDGNDTDLVAVLLQSHGKPAGADGGAVVGVVKLVDDQYDLHNLDRSFFIFPRQTGEVFDIVYHFFAALSIGNCPTPMKKGRTACGLFGIFQPFCSRIFSRPRAS